MASPSVFNGREMAKFGHSYLHVMEGRHSDWSESRRAHFPSFLPKLGHEAGLPRMILAKYRMTHTVGEEILLIFSSQAVPSA